MILDIPTLVVANTLVMSLCGGLLISTWWRGRVERALLWMGSSLLIGAAGIVVIALRGMGIDALSIVLGNALVLLSVAMYWAGMRAFVGRRVSWVAVLAGVSLWCLFCLWPVFFQSLSLRLTLFCTLVLLYMLVTLFELWRMPRKQGLSIVPATLLLGCHSGFYLMRLLADSGSPLNNGSSEFFGWVLIESMLYSVGAGFISLSLVKERAEVHYRAASLTDPLTGIGNRRAFTQAAEDLLSSVAEQPKTLALLVCDLDNFKQINDRLGHPAGDWVIQCFADALRDSLKPHEVFGRIGGEEFACLLETDQNGAVAAAEAIRLAFKQRVQEQGTMSASIGIACASSARLDLSRLLSLADGALYQAKNNGRDCVVVADLYAHTDVKKTEQVRRFR